MTKVLKATSRGQITLPKKWRDQFNTDHYMVQIKNDRLVLIPLLQDDFLESLSEAEKQYQEGEFLTLAELKSKYGL